MTPLRKTLSGIQPSGVLHVGNYLGAVRQWVEQQGDVDAMLMIADAHVITIPHAPANLPRRTLDTVASLLACGVSQTHVSVFLQSAVPAHAQLAWILMSIARVGELSRLGHFADKSERHGASLALLGYPVLQTADILLYDAEEVPVGDDQTQHLEFARDLAIRFNNAYGATFVVPRLVVPAAGARVMDLLDPTRKMSKSAGSLQGVILLDDSIDEIVRKIRRAVTDNGHEVHPDRVSPGVRNLIELRAGLTGRDVDTVMAEFAGKPYSVLKRATADAAVELLGPVVRRLAELREHPGYLRVILEEGTARAVQRAAPRLAAAAEAVGFLECTEAVHLKAH